jgi:hypothetical protein
MPSFNKGYGQLKKSRDRMDACDNRFSGRSLSLPWTGRFGDDRGWFTGTLLHMMFFALRWPSFFLSSSFSNALFKGSSIHSQPQNDKQNNRKKRA